VGLWVGARCPRGRDVRGHCQRCGAERHPCASAAWRFAGTHLRTPTPPVTASFRTLPDKWGSLPCLPQPPVRTGMIAKCCPHYSCHHFGCPRRIRMHRLDTSHLYMLLFRLGAVLLPRPNSLTLCCTHAHTHAPPNPKQPKISNRVRVCAQVVGLGSGPALPEMAAACCGARVLLTDLEPVLSDICARATANVHHCIAYLC
jgi:hypothetical protein